MAKCIQYESIFTKEDTITTILKLAGNPFPSMPDINISEERVLKLPLKISPNKACGPDLITTRILKDLAREIAPFLTRIFQSALNNGDVPKDWKYANVTVIFKKGDRFNASNYRPVSLTCLCCKVQ